MPSLLLKECSSFDSYILPVGYTFSVASRTISSKIIFFQLSTKEAYISHTMAHTIVLQE